MNFKNESAIKARICCNVDCKNEKKTRMKETQQQQQQEAQQFNFL